MNYVKVHRCKFCRKEFIAYSRKTLYCNKHTIVGSRQAKAVKLWCALIEKYPDIADEIMKEVDIEEKSKVC